MADPDGDVLLWPGFTFDYWRRTRAIDLANYRIEGRARLEPRGNLTLAEAAAI